MTKTTDSVTLAITGASGVQYGIRLLQCLLNTKIQVRLLISDAAKVVISTETDLDLPKQSADIRRFFCANFQCDPDQLNVYSKQQWMAPIASGSAVSDAMVICPCSSATLASIAQGHSRTLIERAADVCIKERKKMIVIPRETPLSTIHLENMLKLSQLGVTLLPASPGFYHNPKSVDDLVNFVVARVLDHLEVEHQLVARWGNSI